MRLNEVLKSYRLSGFDIEYKDLYGNVYKKEDLSVEEIFKIEDLIVRNVDINFIRKEVVFHLIDLWELMHKKEGR